MYRTLLLSVLLLGTTHAFELNASIQAYMKTLQKEAKQENPAFDGFDAARGEKIFTSTHIGKRGKPISCVTCHTKDLSQKGENVHTGKVIEPLSPTANPKRFTKVKEVKKWLRRNFRDVYNRVGTAREKGDVITYIIQH